MLRSIFLSFFFSFSFFFLQLYKLWSQLNREKKNIYIYILKYIVGSVLYFFSFNYLFFLLNRIYINLILTSITQYLLTFISIKSFTFIKSSSWTRDKSTAWPVYPRQEQYMWCILLEDWTIFVPSSHWSKLILFRKKKNIYIYIYSTNFVSEKVPGPFCGPFLYLSHGPASAKNEKSNGLKNLASVFWLKKVLDVDLSIGPLPIITGIKI